ncbi:MAG: hypothetical protein IH991_01850 [Planctomycetes bacterium]|nr:hypothetical protein [Planctomycetota bacterium]
MAENEKLDLGYHSSGRWRKLRDSIRAGKSAGEVAEEANRCLAQAFKILQKLFEENNRIPLKQVLMAATGEDGSFDEIMRQSRLGRDYLQLFESQSGQGLDERTIVENVMSLTVDRFMDQIGQEIIGEDRFPDAQSFREFGIAVKDEMIDEMQALGKQIANRPDTQVRLPSRSTAQKDQHQIDLLGMSIGVDEGNQP